MAIIYGLGLSLERIQCYAVLEADLLRWKIIRRNVCTAVGGCENPRIIAWNVVLNLKIFFVTASGFAPPLLFDDLLGKHKII